MVYFEVLGPLFGDDQRVVHGEPIGVAAEEAEASTDMSASGRPGRTSCWCCCPGSCPVGCRRDGRRRW